MHVLFVRCKRHFLFIPVPHLELESGCPLVVQVAMPIYTCRITQLALQKLTHPASLEESPSFHLHTVLHFADRT